MNRKRIFSFCGLVVALLTLCFALTGCGFKPLYGTSQDQTSVSQELARIRVAAIPDREGQLLRNALVTSLTPKGQPRDPAYRLVVNYRWKSSKGAIRKDSSATRNTLSYTAAYQLFQGDQMVTKGAVTRIIGYDYLSEHYANIASERDARVRAADTIALAISNELAAYFVRRDLALQESGTGK